MTTTLVAALSPGERFPLIFKIDIVIAVFPIEPKFSTKAALLIVGQMIKIPHGVYIRRVVHFDVLLLHRETHANMVNECPL